MVSIIEIAEHAGVSTATVSRVLNSSTTVKEKNREKVLKSMSELNYQPNVQARSLRTNKSYNIIALIPTIRNPLFAEIVNGINMETKRSQYNVFIGTLEDNLNNIEPYISMLHSRQADGIIFISSTFNADILSKIQEEYPVVLCNESLDGFDLPLVTIDNVQAGYDSTHYLCSKGKTNIAFVAGRTTSNSTKLRIQGYRKALDEFNIEFKEENIIYGANTDIGYTDLLQQFLDTCKCDGFVVNSDIKAALIVKKLMGDLGYTLDDFNLVSFDGTFITEISNPSLTSITQPMYEIGCTAARMMIDKLNRADGAEPSETRVTLAHQLTIRNT